MRTLITATLALTLTLSGCERSDAPDRIAIAVHQDFGTLLPPVESSALDAELNDLLYLSLNSGRWEDGRLEYVIDDLALADRWEFGPDSLSLTYQIRDDAVWSDGHPIDADDVVFTYELIRSEEVGSVYIQFWEHMDSVVALDDRTVTFHFSRRYPLALFHTGIGIIPEHIFGEAAQEGADLRTHPRVVQSADSLVVSGPFRVAERRPGSGLTLEPNPRAFTARPAADRVVFRVITEPTTRRVELENGDVDVAHPLPPSMATEIERAPGVRIERVRDRFYDYIAWNRARYEPFADPVIRRALSLAIDRESILNALELAPYADPAAGPYPPIFREVADPELRPDPHAPDSALALLASRGWRDENGDGVLERDGTRFEFTLLTQAGNDRRTGAAELIQSQYARIGVRMEVRTVEFNALLGRILPEREFEAVMLGWQVALEPDYLVGQFWPPDHPYNWTGYASAELDTLIPAALDAGTASEAAPRWRAAARVIARDQPYAFLWFFDDLVGVAERVQSTRIDSYGVYQNLYDWETASSMDEVRSSKIDLRWLKPLAVGHTSGRSGCLRPTIAPEPGPNFDLRSSHFINRTCR